MPTNTRTPSGGSTGGSTGSTSTAGGVCWTGGADEAGTIESLEERVLKLEKALALILGQDVETGQLSNISGQIGWVEGVTYLGHEGWTKTQYGSLIPPPGVSLSDLGFDFTFGGRWSLVSVDENGVLQFGLGHLGEVGGAKAEQWDAAGAASYIEFNTDGTSGGGNLLSPFNSVVDSSDDVDDWLSYTTGSGAGTVAFQEEGLYAVYYQTVIIGSSAGVRLPCKASFLSSSTASAVCYGASVVDEDDVETSFLNMSAIFEVPNITAGLSVGEVNSFVPYVEAMPASGSHNFSTVNSTLRIAKIG